MQRHVLSLLVVAGALSAPAVCSADPAWHFVASVTTEAPLAASLRGDLELPGRLRVATSYGMMPSSYVSVVNRLLSLAGGGNMQSSPGLLGMTVDEGTAFRLHGGWRPSSTAGFLMMVGYGRVNLYGSGSARALVEGATGMTPPAGTPESTGTYQIQSTLHMFEAEVGWEWLMFGDRLALRIAGGVSGTVDSRTSIQPQWTSRSPATTAQVVDAAEARVDRTLQSYAITPVFSIGLGYRIF